MGVPFRRRKVSNSQAGGGRLESAMLPSESEFRPTLDVRFGPRPGPIRVAVAPYRLSPVGAHTDHQGGLTSGFTLDQSLRLYFRQRPDGVIRLASREFPGEFFSGPSEAPEPKGTWTDYARGMIAAMTSRGLAVGGFEGLIEGDLAPGGISTSAALQVAILDAALSASGLSLSKTERMHMVVLAERTETGLQVGLLDPAVIIFGDQGGLVVLDCQEGVPRRHRRGRQMPPHEWILVNSGRARSLRSSPYNERVQECTEVASILGCGSKLPRLSETAPETFRRLRTTLPAKLRNRAEHYFAEVKRVRQAVVAWSQGDLVSFGKLVDASGQSLAQLYDCGTPETLDLLTRLRRCAGVLGASFAGAGFGGMLQVLAKPGTSTTLGEQVIPAYAAAWPDLDSTPDAQVVGYGEGARVADLPN